MRRWTQKMRSTRGFTMVELLVVIIIIAVLVAIALPKYFAAIYAGRVHACQSNFKIINTAAQAYFAQNKAWPTQVTDMLQGAQGTAPKGLSGGQLTEAPICPFDVAGAGGTTHPYTLLAVLNDGTTAAIGGGTAANPQVGVEVDPAGHFDNTTGPWQSAATHLP
ncbi:MAG: prepilin-type N-terminal cleavage/methylation domain-containing protein [Armatimonadota bacterium]